VDVLRSIKQALDPLGIMNPERFCGSGRASTRPDGAWLSTIAGKART
jgi:hypothetical protein